MKNYLAALSASGLMSFAPFALAASSTDLTVTGFITPDACTPSLSNEGIVDHGKIPVGDLNPTSNTFLGAEVMQLMISCSGPARVALRLTDNKTGTPSSWTWYGLGQTSAGEKLGFVVPQVTSTLADGMNALSILSTDNGTTWFSHTHMNPGRLLSVAASTDQYTPIAVENLTFDVQVATYINATNNLTLNDETAIDGSATFELVYL